MATPIGVVGSIISSCTIKETLDQVILGAAQKTKTIRQSALDIKIPIDSRTARWSTIYIYQSGAESNIDLTNIPRTIPTDTGVTTFDATGLKVLYFRIRNKAAVTTGRSMLGVALGKAPKDGQGNPMSTVPTLYPLHGFYQVGVNADASVPVPEESHYQIYVKPSNGVVISPTFKTIRIGRIYGDQFIDAEISILLGP